MTRPFYWEDAQEHLTAKDSIMARLIASYPNKAMINYSSRQGS